MKGKISTSSAMIISPIAHPHTGATGNVTITKSGISTLLFKNHSLYKLIRTSCPVPGY